jgi:hypothetical protein
MYEGLTLAFKQLCQMNNPWFNFVEIKKMLEITFSVLTSFFYISTPNNCFTKIPITKDNPATPNEIIAI